MQPRRWFLLSCVALSVASHGCGDPQCNTLAATVTPMPSSAAARFFSSDVLACRSAANANNSTSCGAMNARCADLYRSPTPADTSSLLGCWTQTQPSAGERLCFVVMEPSCPSSGGNYLWSGSDGVRRTGTCTTFVAQSGQLTLVGLPTQGQSACASAQFLTVDGQRYLALSSSAGSNCTGSIGSDSLWRADARDQ